ncbi:MAG: hypothetical protein Fur0032_19270 [Terrimicrobiaceae bacterium]
MKMKPTITVADNGSLQIHIPMLIRRMRGRKTVIAPQALDGEITGAQEPVQSAIHQALGRAFSWADILESGQIEFISELARTLDVDGSYVALILKLTTLAPDIVEALINGERIGLGRERGRAQGRARGFVACGGSARRADHPDGGNGEDGYQGSRR